MNAFRSKGAITIVLAALVVNLACAHYSWGISNSHKTIDLTKKCFRAVRLLRIYRVGPNDPLPFLDIASPNEKGSSTILVPEATIFRVIEVKEHFHFEVGTYFEITALITVNGKEYRVDACRLFKYDEQVKKLYAHPERISPWQCQ